MSEAARTVMIAFGALAAGFSWQAARTAATPTSSPDRLVGELRLAILRLTRAWSDRIHSAEARLAAA